MVRGTNRLGSESNHFHKLSISQHAIAGREFMADARLMVTRRRWGAGKERRVWD